jgi:hypothetical protein
MQADQSGRFLESRISTPGVLKTVTGASGVL